MQASHLLIYIAFFAFVSCDDHDAKLRYYYRNFENFTEYPLSEAHKIFALDWYNSSRPTVIFAHGFTGRPTGPAVEAVLGAYLEQDESNVALLNWEHLAASVQANLPNSYVNWAAPNARMLGFQFAETLKNLSGFGLDLEQIHLVGHSLGAQVFGIAGNQLQEKGIRLPWITGLDPAGVGFEGRPLPARLHAGSAGFVAVIHSDPNKYGFARSMGTVDFWPNFKIVGPVRQPGCDSRPHPMFSPEDLCSHNRCWELLVDSLRYPGTLLGSYARNYRIWRNYSKKEREANVLEIGKFYKEAFSGNYYFVTKDATPYGLGRKGL